MRLLAAAIACAALTGCDALPRDPEGTLGRVRTTGTIRVGVATTAIAPEAGRLLAAVAAETRAAPVLRPVGLEPGIAALEDGRLDLVIADITEKTPWKAQVAVAPPLTAPTAGAMPIAQHALMRNGENRWIMLVERAARRVASPAAR